MGYNFITLLKNKSLTTAHKINYKYFNGFVFFWNSIDVQKNNFKKKQ
jgi:hypothetical protein